MLAPDLTDPHIAALLQGVRDLSLDPGVVEPEPEVNPAASESSSSESESVSVVSADNLDRGSWRASWLLLRYADPIETPKFGGEPQDLERVAGYLNALQKLEKRAKGLGKGDQEEGGGKGKKGKQNPKKQAEETTM